MASIEFHYRPSIREKRSKGSVYIRVIHRRQTASVTTPWKLYPEEWDRRENRIAYLADNEQRFPLLAKTEKEMTRTLGFLEGTIENWEIQDQPFTAHDIIAAYHRREGAGLFSDFVEKLYRELHASGQERTARGYLTTRNRLLGFMSNPRLRLKELTGLVVRRFEMHLEKEGKTPNTISFYMRNLRAIYNKAIAEGLLESTPHNPFEYVYTGVQITKKRALSIRDMTILQSWKPLEEVKSEELKMKNVPEGSRSSLHNCHTMEGLMQARQLFLFCFLARGMSFIDMAFLRKENLRDGVIYYRRKKTGQPIEVKVDTDMMRIIRYFEKRTKDSPYIFPVICKPGKNERLQYESALRTQNNRLKRLSAVLGVKSEKLKVKETTVPPSNSSFFTFHSPPTWRVIAGQR